MGELNISVGERAIVVAIDGHIKFRKYLLANGITLGTILTKNYSPTYSKLVNFSVGGKMLSLRASDFLSIDLVKI